jgi:hypothetical protein
MPKRTEAIKTFLTLMTHADLAESYYAGMEVQVNVAQDGGDRVSSEGFKGRQWHSYSDGAQEWYSFRIPKKAFSDPENNDFKITYDLAAHAEGIGLTGWDWQKRISKWVGFDFDAIAGHSGANALTDSELDAVRKAATAIPWVTVRRSTSGSGLHLYVYLNDVPTATHNEHSALARAILGKMAATTGFDFSSKVDTCGTVLWIWHRKMTPTNHGLELVKKGEVLTDIPINWKDHIDVVRGNRRRTLPKFVENEDQFNELTGQRPHTKLDDGHKKLLDYLEKIKAQWWWDADHHMLVCHTTDLKNAYSKLQLRGIFNTIATGKEQGADHNCFAYPLDHPNGGWVVRRYTQGIQESSNWEQDGSGWTRCYFNCDPSLKIAAQTFHGMEDEKGAFHFVNVADAVKAAQSLGIKIRLPDWAHGHKAKVHQHKDGRLVISFEKKATDHYDDIPGWREEKSNWWQRIFNANLQQTFEPEAIKHDDVVRHLVSDKRTDRGWVVNNGQWCEEPYTNIRLALKAHGLRDAEVNKILGDCVLEPWTLVNEPFQSEFPGGRLWNRDAPQLRYKPTEDEPFNCPTWYKVLEQCGKGLDSAVTTDGWCRANGILKGSDYLKIWIASLFQYPKEQLPYLFLYSKEEKTGKSTFHEALEMLMTGGYMRADVAIISSSGFNGELEGQILCVVEETNLQKAVVARNRIKDWVMSKSILIHPKGRTPYQVRNTVHFVQTGNKIDECPIFSGDTRITMIHVPVLDMMDMIPRNQLHQQLKQEAPDFLGEIMRIEIPLSGDRLNVPIVESEIKKLTADSNRDALEIFLDEVCYEAPGEVILYSELFDRFQEWLDPMEVHEWSKIRMGKELPHKYPKGRLLSAGAQFHIGNLSFTEPENIDRPRMVLFKDKLIPEK